MLTVKIEEFRGELIAKLQEENTKFSCEIFRKQLVNSNCLGQGLRLSHKIPEHNKQC